MTILEPNLFQAIFGHVKNRNFFGIFAFSLGRPKTPFLHLTEQYNDWLEKIMTIEEAIDRLESHTQYYVPVEDLDAFDVAIAALCAHDSLLLIVKTHDGPSVCVRLSFLNALTNQLDDHIN